MKEKKKWILIGCTNLVLAVLLILSIFVGTTTRQSIAITNKDRVVEIKGDDVFQFSFDTNGNDIVGMEIHCAQSGKPINQGYLVYGLYQNEVLQGEYRQALGNVSVRDDVLQLNFGTTVNGYYTLKAHFEEVNPWDSLRVYYGAAPEQRFWISKGAIRGAIAYNFVVETQTHPYIFYVVLLFAFVNIFWGLYGGYKGHE